MYDIIGDIHGEADLLKKLLIQMGYTQKNKCFSHPERTAIFVGDFINRGSKIRETLQLIRTMHENGKAMAILGNHELYALFYMLKNEQGEYYKKRRKYRLSLDLTLKEFVAAKDEWKSHLKWMRTLPFSLEPDGIRIVHACWKDENMEQIKTFFNEGKIKKSKLRLLMETEHPVMDCIWETTKGLDFRLPKDLLVFDSTGRPHRAFRSKWWATPEGKTFKDVSFESRFKLPKYTIPKEIIPQTAPYPEDAPPVFFGHYCMNGKNGIVKNNVCCVDSCVGRSGELIAYRWSGEKILLPENFEKAKNTATKP